MPDGEDGITATFDLHDHRLMVETGAGRRDQIALEPMSVAQFYTRFRRLVTDVGGNPRIHGRPNEMPEAIPFAEDRGQRPYDAAAVVRFHQALLRIADVFTQFRTGFLGKASPVRICSGEPSNLAVTRFSGRRGPLHPGGCPNLPDSVTREASSHEVSSAGLARWRRRERADVLLLRLSETRGI